MNFVATLGRSRAGLTFALAVCFVLCLACDLRAQQSCELEWAHNVVSHHDGYNQDLNFDDPHDVLGDTPSTYFNLGKGGNVVVDFGQNYTNSGDSGIDVCVREFGNSDCYYICFFPADAFTTNAVIAAGMTGNNGWYEFNVTYCDDTDLDIDALVPGYSQGQLQFSKIMILDDGSTGNGAEIEQICGLLCVPTPPTNGCQLEWATSVVSHHDGSSQDPNNADPHAVVGDTPSTYFHLGIGGKVVVEFSENTTTSGDSSPDFCVREEGNNDCYYICFHPADAFTVNAVLAAGMHANGNGFYEFSITHCGDVDFDLDALVPGFQPGQLQFSKIMILDDSAGGGSAEIEQICGLVCPPPVPPTGCQLLWAQNVLSSHAGANQISTLTDPQAVLGDTPTTQFSLGKGGNVVVDFGANYTTSGDSGVDVCVREWNKNDCYYICLFPADNFTANALTAAGLSENNGYYEFNTTFCGDTDLDLDALIPGYSEGQLQFSKIMIVDDFSSGDGAEIHQICGLVCPPSNNCVVVWADSVKSSQQGSNPASNSSVGDDAAAALGDTPGTGFALGDGGEITVCFLQDFTNTGNNEFDLCIDEFNVVDCYDVLVEAGSGSTHLALLDAGFVFNAGFFNLGQYCGDVNIDLDALVPGFSEGQLLFKSVKIVDDSNGGDGAEIMRVCATVCTGSDNPLAELGDCVFVDKNCDGVLDGGDEPKPHTMVVLVRASDGQVVDFMQTGLDGKYSFKNIIPGDYLVVFNFNEVSYAATTPDVGSDDTVDSDFDPNVGFVPITLSAGEVNLDLDFGVCEVCVGLEATKVSLPCGYDPVNDPVLDATLLIPGEPITFTLKTVFPFANSWIYFSFGSFPSVFYQGCNWYIDVLNLTTNVGIGIIGQADANGCFVWTSPDVVPAGLDGFTVVFQGRICAPGNIPGPFAPAPDFFSNGLIMTIGCP